MKLEAHQTAEILSDDITAVAEMEDPLLQMLEIQDAEGNLYWDDVNQLHEAALLAEQKLLECACAFRNPHEQRLGEQLASY